VLTRLTLLVLALAAGITDAIGYLAFGRVFTANMTGNTVVLGVAVAQGSGGEAARSGAALGGFCVGVAAGVFVLPRSRGHWPRSAARAFALEAAALAGVLGLWAAGGLADVRYELIVLTGVAMGVQSAGARAAPVGGVNTTYVTGTLTNAIARAIGRARRQVEANEPAPALPGGVWAIYLLGALGGGLAERAWHAGAVALPLALVSLVVVTAAVVRPQAAG
jgi:uncharacterized membrane protein YoaK (UPF0700 family)